MAGEDSPTRSRTSRDRDVHVRPIDYVAEEAVVRRIGDRDVSLGNRHAADPAAHDRCFDHVLSLTADAHPLTTHHHPLVDGEGNDWETFADAVDAARRLHRREGDLLVHCKAGVSRSTTVLATAIAAEEDRRFAVARSLVVDARPAAVVNPALCELAVVYLAAEA